MTVPVLITDLSTTALLNAPSGEDAPSTLDNIQRAHAAFIAKLRDESATTASISNGTLAGSFTTLTASGAATFPAGAQVTGAVLLGYGPTAGGTVTQATSKTTAVTLNKPCGVITLNNAALASGAAATFTLNNSLISVTDTVVCHHDGAAGTANAYVIQVMTAGAGSISFRVVNVSAGSLSEPLTLTFSVVKAVAA